MRTIEDPANPLSEFISAQQTIGFDHFPLAVNPFGLYGVQPRALLGQQADDNPHSIFSALFDLTVVPTKPTPHLAAYVPCLAQIRRDELRVAQIRAPQVRAFKPTSPDLRRAEIRVPEVNSAEI
jgi:hypothetical protein